MKERKLGHKHPQREGHVKTQKEDSQQQTNETSEVTNSADILLLNFYLLIKDIVRKLIFAVEATLSVVLCYGSPN